MKFIQTPSKKPLVVIGIGMSAGGFPALKSLLPKRPFENMCVVIAQHMDDAGKAIALEGLQHLSAVPAELIQDGTQLSPSKVFLVPPHALVSFKQGRISLETANTTAQKLSVVDHLLSAIGQEYGETAIGVVLSGEAGDGARGLRELNDLGGLTLAQDPETAEHRSMPDTAISTGAVDHILAPKQMWDEIQSYAEFIVPNASDPKKESLKQEITAAITSICETLHQKTRHDFKHYKTSTLVRRLQRRMQVLQHTGVQQYLDHLVNSPDECSTLFNELLINVTSFFRDKEAFNTLSEEVLRPLITSRQSGQRVRVWVAGCSTGEEAYSLAILIREIIETLASPPEVQIIATDIDDSALDCARRGAYSATIGEHVNPNRLARFFVKKSGKYHVAKEIREMCLFSVHNLITDPPFSQLDIISCRNVLIYLGSHLQKKLFPVFHYALRSNGFLFLGSSETLTSHRELFKIVSNRHRIAQRKATAIKLPSINTSVQNYLSHFQENEKVTEADLDLIGQRIALDEMPLRFVVVNDEGSILSSSAGIAKYLYVQEGTFQNNVIKLAHPSLKATLRSTFSTAKKEKRKITNDLSTVKVDEGLEKIRLIVQPMPQLGDVSELYWIAFQSLGLVHVKDTSTVQAYEALDTDLINQLELELSAVRQELDKSVQDLEASNEELKSSNEELLSMNEELQSANEELETSKEEVQISNDALTRANSDLENLLASTQIATLFLDDEYRINGFTPAISEIYNVHSSDVGRRLSDFTSRAQEIAPYPTLDEVKAKAPIEDEVALPDGRTFLRRILPYKTPEQAQQGVVVTFIDVTELRRSEIRRAEGQRRFETMFQTSPSFLAVLRCPDFIFESANPQIYKLLGTRDLIGRSIKQALPEIAEQGFLKLLEGVRDSGQPYIGREVPAQIQRTPHGPPEAAFMDFVYQADFDEHGTVTRVFVHGNDVTEKVLARQGIENERENFRNLFKQTPEMVCILSGPEHRFEFVNDAHVKVLGFDATGMTVPSAQPESVEVHGILDDVYRTGKTAELFEIPITVGHRVRFFNLTYAARRSPAGKIDGVMILGLEVTNEVTNRIRLEDSESYFRGLVDTSPAIVWMTDLEAKCTYLSRQWYETTGGTPEHDLGYGWVEHVHPEDREAASKAFFSAINARGKISIHYRLAQRDGSYRWAVDSGLPRLAADGTFLGYIGTVIDIHDQITSQERLVELQRRFENSVTATNLGVWYCDLPFDELIWNEQVRQHFFMNPTQKVTIRDFYRHIHPDDRELTEKSIQASIVSHQTYDIVYRTIDPNDPGQIKWIRAIGWTDYDKDGAPTRFDGITLDVTKDHFREMELKIAKEDAEKASVAKTSFLANMSHEIRTPLSAIVGFSDLLRAKMGTDGKVNSYIDRITRNSNQLSRLIDELLDLSKIEANKFQIEPAVVDVDAIIEDVKSAMILKAEERHLELSFEWLTSKPARINTDPVRLSQVLINVVGNAVKFTEIGGVKVTLSSDEETLSIRVVDTGVGLSLEQQSRIFQPFVQADASITRRFGGTGLGLVLSKRICALLGGDLVLEKSAEAQGSTFLVTVSTRLGDVYNDFSENELGNSNDHPIVLEGSRILVVDDSPDNRTIVGTYLRSAGAVVYEVDNGLEATKVATQRSLDLILLDIQMPKMDGYQTLAAIKAAGILCPILAITAHAFKEERERCLAAGFSSYLTKPVNRSLLIRTVKEQLKQSE